MCRAAASKARMALSGGSRSCPQASRPGPLASIMDFHDAGPVARFVDGAAVEQRRDVAVG